MPTRPDLRDITTGVRDALADCDREALLDMLTFVIKEYVVDGPPPMLMHQTESVSDLASLSFAQLITSLQTRLELPELALFAVDGEQVSVRVGGVMQPLHAGRGATPAADLPRPSAGVRVVESQVAMRPPERVSTSQANAPQAPMPPGLTNPERGAPPAARGLSVRGQPAGAMAPRSDERPAPPAVPQQPGGGQPNAPQAQPERPESSSSGDDASARFSLLELD